MANKDIIHFIITGGTIDSYYNGSKDTVVPNEHSVIFSYLKSIGLDENKVGYTEICMKDSRHLDQSDLQAVLGTIENNCFNKFIITHGTYTMPDTARFLEARLERKRVTVVLTGSMIPLIGFSPSDAGFSLGYAVAQVRQLPSGVYVCMQGETFKPNEVAKDMGRGRFYSILGEGKKHDR